MEHNLNSEMRLLKDLDIPEMKPIIEPYCSAGQRESITLPCPIGSDCWWVSSETLEVECEEGGITGFVILEGEILALDKAGERMEIHSQWCCLSREEAEAIREQLLKE